MSKKVNPAAVGIFVAGALTIFISAVIVLGSGKLFEKHGKFVIYFESSANGLSEGSDVLLGGVKVGSVSKMFVDFDPDSNRKVIPVVIDLSASRIAGLSAARDTDKSEVLSRENVQAAIDENGLRARLMSKSALTGQLYVDLEFFADDPGGYNFPGETVDGLQQIPSVKNQIEQVLETLATSMEGFQEADVPGLVKNANELITNLNAKISDLDVKGVSDKANSTLDGINKVFSDERISSTVGNIESASAELKDLLASIDAEALNNAIRKADKSMGSIALAAGNISALTDQRASLAVNFTRALTGIEKATKAFQELAEFLKRNPNALITGKKRP